MGILATGFAQQRSEAMEDFLESATGGAIWGLGFGLAGLALTGFGRGLRPVAKTIVKGGIIAGDWIRNATEESREQLKDIYEEARAERAEPRPAPAPERSTVSKD